MQMPADEPVRSHPAADLRQARGALQPDDGRPRSRRWCDRGLEAILPLEACGFDRALRIQAYIEVHSPTAGPMSFMVGFDEFIEIDKPGHMAAEAAKRPEIAPAAGCTSGRAAGRV